MGREERPGKKTEKRGDVGWGARMSRRRYNRKQSKQSGRSTKITPTPSQLRRSTCSGLPNQRAWCWHAMAGLAYDRPSQQAEHPSSSMLPTWAPVLYILCLCFGSRPILCHSRELNHNVKYFLRIIITAPSLSVEQHLGTGWKRHHAPDLYVSLLLPVLPTKTESLLYHR